MPDNVSIQGLQFQISTKTSDPNMTKGINNFKEALNKMSSASEKASGKLQGLSKSLGGFSQSSSSKKLTKLADGLSALGSVKLSTTIAKNLDAINTAAGNLSDESIAKVRQLADALKNLQGTKLNFNLNNGAGSATVQQPQIPKTDLKTQAIDMASAGVGKFRDALGGVSNTLGTFLSGLSSLHPALGAVGGVLSTVTRGAIGLGKALASTLAFGVKAVTAGLSRLPSLLQGVGGFIKSLPGRIARLIPGVSGLTSRFGQLFSSIKRIALYRAIRFFFAQLTSAMKEGINNLYQYSAAMGGTFKASMDSLASSFLYLKNSMGAMVAPLINALAPAVEYVIDKFVGLLNIVNQFFSALTGKKTTTVAKRVPTTFKEIGDSASDAAGNTSHAVKELKKSLLGFDELNILNDNKSPSGGGSGGSGSSGTSGANYADMFETIDVDSGISDWVEDLKKAFNEGDWKTLGTMLGSKFNELIDDIPWDSIGEKVGTSLSGAISTAYYFFKEADFYKLGAKLGEFLDKALSKMLEPDEDGDTAFTKLGKLLSIQFTSILDTVIGLVNNLPSEKIGKSFHDFFTGLFDELTDWLNSYSWDAEGQIIYRKLKNFFEGLQPGDIASSIAEFLGTAIRSAGELIGGFVGALVDDFMTEWKKRFEAKQAEGNGPVMSFIKTAFSFAGDIVTWIKENIIEPFMRGLTGDENWEFPDLGNIGKKFWNKLAEGWGDIKKWWDDHLFKPLGEAFGDFSLDDMSTKVTDVITPEKLFSGLQTAWGDAKKWVKDNIAKPFTDAFGDPSNWTLPNLSELGKNLWDRITGAIGTAFGNIGEFFSGLFDFKVDLSGFGVSLKNTDIMVTLDGVIDKSFNVMEKAWESVTNSTVVKTIKGKFGEGWKTVKDAWEKIKKEGVVKTIKGKIGEGWTRVKDAWGSIKTKAATLKAKVTGGAAGVVDKIKSKWEYLKKHSKIEFKASFFGKVGDAVKSAWNSFVVGYRGVRQKINNFSSKLGLKVYLPDAYKLARGGIVDGETSAIIGEAGKEAVLPLERNLGWQKTLAEQLVAKMGTTQSSDENARMLYVETTRQNDLLTQQNRLLQQILNKDTDVHISATSIQEGLARKNMRDGRTVVPVY